MGAQIGINLLRRIAKQMRAGKNQTINCQTSKMSREKDKRHGLFKTTKKKH